MKERGPGNNPEIPKVVSLDQARESRKEKVMQRLWDIQEEIAPSMHDLEFDSNLDGIHRNLTAQHVELATLILEAAGASLDDWEAFKKQKYEEHEKSWREK